ncbi:MAG: alpha/beta hydrolase fold domain-containing protein, partial [Pseudoxanthomonas sp.]
PASSWSLRPASSASASAGVSRSSTPADADALLAGLSDQLEAGRPAAWRPADMGARYAGLSRGVVGFHAQIKRVRSRFKLGQDERASEFADILRALAALGGGELRQWMQRFGQARALDLPALPGPAPAPLDPQVKRFVDEVMAQSRQLAGGRALDWPARRQIAETTRRPWRQGGPQPARREDLVADTEAGPVRLRLFDPAPGASKPTLVYLHGGGWAMFSLDTHERLMREYAARAGMAVVGVDYALAPEHRYPFALNQVVGVVRWLRAHAAAHGLDAQRLALGGDSAGAALSVGAALKLRDAGEGDAVKAILSNYGGFGPEVGSAARLRYGTEQDMLSAAEIDEFWDTYVGHVEDRCDSYAVPLLADLRGLPPVFLVVAECDVLAEQSLQLGGALLAARVPVRIEVYPGASHSFIEAMAVSALANRAIDDGVAWLRERLGAVGQPREHAA